MLMDFAASERRQGPGQAREMPIGWRVNFLG